MIVKLIVQMIANKLMGFINVFDYLNINYNLFLFKNF